MSVNYTADIGEIGLVGVILGGAYVISKGIPILGIPSISDEIKKAFQGDFIKGTSITPILPGKNEQSQPYVDRVKKTIQTSQGFTLPTQNDIKDVTGDIQFAGYTKKTMTIDSSQLSGNNPQQQVNYLRKVMIPGQGIIVSNFNYF